MPKHGFLTPKAISNRIKSKGLQKLRWYCQMCQKQCRDENGFKCHMMSESHQRQMLLVAENPGKYIGAFSQEFLRDFMSLLRLQYGTRRVRANEVYQEYIKDKNHYHMNATRWETLTGFVMFLGKTGMCEVEPSEKGWYIKYIDRSPETLARQAAADKKKKMDKDDEERIQQAIELQIERALASKRDEDDMEPVYTELKRESEDERIAFSLKLGGASVGESSSAGATSLSNEASLSSTRTDQERGTDHVTSEDSEEESDEEREGDERDGHYGEEEKTLSATSSSTSLSTVRGGASTSTATPTNSSSSGGGGGGKKKIGSVDGFARPKAPLSKQAPLALPNALKLAASAKRKEREGSALSTSSQGESRKRKRSALEEIKMMEEQRKEKVNRRENWITEGIVVKVMHKKLGDRFYKKKGVVVEVRDMFTGVVKIIETGDKIKIDQAHLETVIPAIGKAVMVVNGAYRGLRAVLEGLNTDSFCVTIKIDQGPARGRIIDRVPYEDISKLA